MKRLGYSAYNVFILVTVLLVLVLRPIQGLKIIFLYTLTGEAESTNLYKQSYYRKNPRKKQGQLGRMGREKRQATWSKARQGACSLRTSHPKSQTLTQAAKKC